MIQVSLNAYKTYQFSRKLKLILSYFRSAILTASPNLKELDGDVLSGNQENKKQIWSQFEAMCLSQIQAQDDLQAVQQGEIE